MNLEREDDIQGENDVAAQTTFYDLWTHHVVPNIIDRLDAHDKLTMRVVDRSFRGIIHRIPRLNPVRRIHLYPKKNHGHGYYLHETGCYLILAPGYDPNTQTPKPYILQIKNSVKDPYVCHLVHPMLDPILPFPYHDVPDIGILSKYNITRVAGGLTYFDNQFHEAAEMNTADGSVIILERDRRLYAYYMDRPKWELLEVPPVDLGNLNDLGNHHRLVHDRGVTFSSILRYGSYIYALSRTGQLYAINALLAVTHVHHPFSLSFPDTRTYVDQFRLAVAQGSLYMLRFLTCKEMHVYRVEGLKLWKQEDLGGLFFVISRDICYGMSSRFFDADHDGAVVVLRDDYFPDSRLMYYGNSQRTITNVQYDPKKNYYYLIRGPLCIRQGPEEEWVDDIYEVEEEMDEATLYPFTKEL